MTNAYGLLLWSLLVAACGDDKETAGIKSAIAGTYIRQSESEYSKAMDTLIVTAYDARAGTYIILRRTGFHRIKGGTLQPKENKVERMIAVWDEETQQLQELKQGKLYTFPASGGELLAGTAKYRKVN